jgi:hypothetical protein
MPDLNQPRPQARSEMNCLPKGSEGVSSNGTATLPTMEALTPNESLHIEARIAVH